MPSMPSSSGRPGRVSEVIARRIKKQISDGRLAAGHKLPAERDMARQFKTSRVSVREAYRSLEEVGLLRIRRGAEGGAFIAQFDHEPVRRSLSLVLGLGKTSHEELTEARVLLEPAIARLAALRARADHVATLEEVLLQEEQEVRRRRPAANPGKTAGQFHRAIAACAQNMPLVVLMNALADLTAESVSALDVRIRSRNRRKNCEFHRQILEAIRAHDGEAAYAVMLQHVGDIQDRVRRTMTKAAHDGFCVPAAGPRRSNGRRR